MSYFIQLYNGSRIDCDSVEEAEALLWVAKVSPYSIEQAASLFEYFKGKHPKDTWEVTLQRVAAILHLCSQSGQGVSTILTQMMKADLLGKPWPI